MKPKIIGVTGLKRAGKDTIADYLYYRYNYQKRHFATPIKSMISALLRHIEIENPTLYVDDQKEINLPVLNVSYRKLAQTLGTEWGRGLIDNDIWINIAKHHCKNNNFVCFADVRFDNEAKLIADLGGIIIKINRGSNEYLMDIHPSELGISDKYINYTISNIGTIRDIHNKVDEILCI